jgi:hypothetical protein
MSHTPNARSSESATAHFARTLGKLQPHSPIRPLGPLSPFPKGPSLKKIISLFLLISLSVTGTALAEPIPIVPGEVYEFSIGPTDTIELQYTVENILEQVTVTLAKGSDVANCNSKGPLPIQIHGVLASVDQGAIAKLGPTVFSAPAPPDTYSLTVTWDPDQLAVIEQFNCTPPDLLTFELLVQVEPIEDNSEPDNTPEQARWLGANGQAQVHRLPNENDEDWMVFSDTGPSDIDISITPVIASAAPTIELYAADGQTLLASAPGSATEVVHLEYQNPLTTPALFYVRLFIDSKSAMEGVSIARGAAITGYESIAANETGTGDEPKGAGGVFVVEANSSGGPLLAALAGTVTEDATGDPIEGATVTLEDLGGASTLTNPEGIYAFNGLPQDSITVSAEADGFAIVSTGIDLGGGINQIDFFLGEGGTGGGGCFIATAAYGTPLAREIDTLRNFRDHYLLTNAPGAAITDAYYTVSPTIARYIAQSPAAAQLTRTSIHGAIASTRAVAGHPVLFILATIGAVGLLSRRHRKLRTRKHT